MTSPSDSPRAKPCPFCNASGAKIVPAGAIYWEVECQNCGARGPHHEAGTGALALWNTRPLLSAPREPTEELWLAKHWRTTLGANPHFIVGATKKPDASGEWERVHVVGRLPESTQEEKKP